MTRPTIRQVLAAERPLVTPLAHDALSARLIQRAGFRAFTVGGSALLAARHAFPDIGLIGVKDMTDGLRDIAAACDLPYIADADDGYGDVKSIARTVADYEAIGVGGLLIEDQHRDRKQQRADKAAAVVDEAVIAQKLRAAMAARANPETFIIGRTDAYGTLGLEGAIRRGEGFLKLGVDGVFIAGLRTPEDYERVGRQLNGAILLAAMFEGGGTPWIAPAELGRMGFRAVSFPVSLMFRVVAAMHEALANLRDFADGKRPMTPMKDFAAARAVLDDAVELKRWRDIETRFGDPPLAAPREKKRVSAAPKAEAPKPNARLFGSDPVAAMLRALDFEYIALTPGASFRGLHDSLVNYLGNTRPELLLCIHEEHAVSIAHGWTRVTGKPMAVAVHANVGLMHATMAIFNAWCDRIPMLLLGAVGPMDAVHRRPWVDWIHTATDLAALVRGYTKWDNQPGSVPAALEAMLRGYHVANTEPKGPVYICLDATLQEQPVDPGIELPKMARFRAGGAADPAREDVAAAAAILRDARRPLILMGRVSRQRADWDKRVKLAERLGACVLTDLKTGATFPSGHELQPYPPGLYVTPDAGALIRDADAILALDWVDLGGTVRQACAGQLPAAKIIHCSLDQYVHNGWSMDYQALPPADVSMLASPDRLVDRLLEEPPPRPRPKSVPARAPAPERGPDTIGGRLSVQAVAGTVTDALAPHNPAYIRLPLGWPGDCCRFEDPLDYIGFDGGGGIGSGPGMAVGAALALRGSGRLPVAVLGDGDYLMGLTALWTGVHYRIPVLIIVANNESFFNDELHQERVARIRGRPVENRSIGLRMSDPPNDLAMLARGQGAVGIGPVKNVDELKAAIEDGVRRTRAGAVCVIDAAVAPEYSRGISSTLLRQIPSAS